MIDITKNEFLKLEKSGVFARYKKRFGYYPFNKTKRKYAVEKHKWIVEELNKTRNSTIPAAKAHRDSQEGNKEED